MILPLGDSPNPRGFPIINYALIVANISVYVLLSLPLGITPIEPSDPRVVEYLRAIPQHAEGQPEPELATVLERLSSYDLFVFEHGFRPSQPSFEDLFASLFLHAGFLHLFGNMLILWIYGDNIEHRLGSIGYLFAYLATGIAATLFHLALAPDSPLPLIGASGAISGILGLYFRWFPHNKVRLFVFLFPFLMDVFIIPARLVLGFYLIGDNLLPLLLHSGSGSGIAYGAHIGGFVGGMLTAWLMDQHTLRQRPREYAAAVAPSEEASPLDHQLDAGDFESAARTYFALPAHSTIGLLSPAQGLALAEWLRNNRHTQAALTVYRRLLRDHQSGPGAAEANLGAGLVLLEDLGQPTPAYQYLLDVLDCGPSPEIAERARAALLAIVEQDKFKLGKRPTSAW